MAKVAKGAMLSMRTRLATLPAPRYRVSPPRRLGVVAPLALRARELVLVALTRLARCVTRCRRAPDLLSSSQLRALFPVELHAVAGPGVREVCELGGSC